MLEGKRKLLPFEKDANFLLLEGSAAIFGVMFVGWMEFGFYFVKNNEVSWRFPIAFQALFPLIVMTVVCVFRQTQNLKLIG